MKKYNHNKRSQVKALILEELIRSPSTRVKLKEKRWKTPKGGIENKNIDYHIARGKNSLTTTKLVKEQNGTLVPNLYNPDTLVKIVQILKCHPRKKKSVIRGLDLAFLSCYVSALGDFRYTPDSGRTRLAEVLGSPIDWKNLLQDSPRMRVMRPNGEMDIRHFEPPSFESLREPTEQDISNLIEAGIEETERQYGKVDTRFELAYIYDTLRHIEQLRRLTMNASPYQFISYFNKGQIVKGFNSAPRPPLAGSSILDSPLWKLGKLVESIVIKRNSRIDFDIGDKRKAIENFDLRYNLDAHLELHRYFNADSFRL